MRNKVKLKPRFKIYSLVAAFKTLFQAHFTKTSTNHSKILRYGYHICLFSAHFSRQVASLVPSPPGMKKANFGLNTKVGATSVIYGKKLCIVFQKMKSFLELFRLSFEIFHILVTN